MSYKPDESAWMAYVYGELEDSEKQKFEAYLVGHPEARAELERYEGLRTALSELRDKEVIAPPIFVAPSAEDRRADQRFFWKSRSFRTSMSIAASVVLILVAGRLADARLSVSNHSFSITFGTPPVAEAKLDEGVTGISRDVVQEMIDSSLEENNQVLHQALGARHKDLEQSLRTNLALNSGRINQLVSEASVTSQEQIRAYVEAIRSENMEQVKSYLQMTSMEQKQYIENLLVDFAKYLQQQRNHDLQLVQTRMNSIEQDSDLFREETEQILSSIITTVGTPVSEDTRY